MGWEVRAVPLDWKHPLDPELTAQAGEPRFAGLASRAAYAWYQEFAREDMPPEDQFMPLTPAGVPLGYQLYTTVSDEPYDIDSPVCRTLAELAEWAATHAFYDRGEVRRARRQGVGLPRRQKPARWRQALAEACHRHGIPVNLETWIDAPQSSVG